MKQEVNIEQKIINSQMLNLINFFEKDESEIKEIFEKEALKNPFLKIYDQVYGYEIPEDYSAKNSSGNILENIFMQIDFLKISKEDKKIFKSILECLDQKGFLPEGKIIIAKELGISPSDLIKKINIIQKKITPEGLCCENYIEFLEFQIDMCNELTKDEKSKIKGRLEFFFLTPNEEVSKKLNIDIGRIVEIKEVIKEFQQSPIQIEPSEIINIYPEIEVKISKNREFSIKLIRKFQVELKEQLSEFTVDIENRNQNVQYFKKAKTLVDFLEKRDENILNIATYMINKQKEYFFSKKLLTLTLKEISQNVNLHISTVSRVLKNKYMISPNGIEKIGILKAKGIDTVNSRDSIKDEIKNIILLEGKITDQRIADILENKGMKISRRTVTKYRNQIGG